MRPLRRYRDPEGVAVGAEQGVRVVDGAVLVEGASSDIQGGGVLLDGQQGGLLRCGRMSLDHVLPPLRCQACLGQLGVDREARAGAQQVGKECSGEPVLLDGHRDRVGGQQATQVVDLGLRLQLERLRDGLVSRNGLGLQHDDAGLHPSTLHLLGEGGQSNLEVELRR